MSWLRRSLANSLRLDDDGDDEGEEHEDSVSLDHGTECSTPKHEGIRSPPSWSSPEEEAQARGVKEDLTELKQTLTRQLWGVANFLAPPPATAGEDRSVSDVDESEPSDGSGSEGEEEAPDSAAVSAIRSDLAEIGGKLRSGVSGISVMASNYFPFESDEKELEDVEQSEEGNEEFEGEEEDEEEELEEEEDEEEITLTAVGITDEVLAFARNIAMHPETWLDFPLDPDEDLDDFNISEAQQNHALIIERFAPRLAALRIELCPCHMSKSYFWKVYFVLLHSRLSKQVAEKLSTPQVMKARALWMQELKKQKKTDIDWYGRSTSSLKDRNNGPEEVTVPSSCSYALPEFLSPSIYSFEPPSLMKTDYEMVKHPVENSAIQFIDKAVIEEKPVSKIVDRDLIIADPSSKTRVPSYEDDDDWPDEEDSEFVIKTPIFLGNEEDISFSDLEDDDVGSLLIKSKTISKGLET